MKSLPTSCTRNGRAGRVFVLLCAALPLSFAASLCIGSVRIPPAEVFRAIFGLESGTVNANIILLTRLPRALGCFLAGAALAVSGAVIQSVLSNPLAAPNIIGVNAGAGAAVALCSALAPAVLWLAPWAAFAGALAAVLLVLFISEKSGASRITLVLSGVAVSGIFGAVIDTVISFVPDALNGYTDFRIGGFANLSMTRILPASYIIGLCLLLILLMTSELDVLMLGTETARSLGMNTRRYRVGLLALSAALAGAAVSFAGLLGFVGLIVPHMMRRLVGGGAGTLIPACALGGAVILALCDLLSRVVFAPYELPVGILLSLAGGPFFIWLLLKQRGGRIHD